MPNPSDTPNEAQAWMAMAEHFLDTETRQHLPLTAYTCLESGMDEATVRAHWLKGVAPVVGPNLLSVAGEWACWDEEWLVQRVGRRLLRGAWRWWPPAPANRECLDATLAFMQVLAPLSGPARLEEARLLSDMGDHYFDFAPQSLPRASLVRARALEAPFLAAMHGCTLSEERAAANTRLRGALRPGRS